MTREDFMKLQRNLNNLNKETEILFKEVYLKLRHACLVMIEKHPEQKKHWEQQLAELDNSIKSVLPHTAKQK